MRANPRKQGSKSPVYFLNCTIGISFLLAGSACFAGAPVVITGNTIINTPTVYNDVVLDMTNGRFTINTGGSLKIENSTIKSTISPSNPFFVNVSNGSLTVKNNTVNVAVTGITPNPNARSLYQYVQLNQGNVTIDGNTFTANTFYTLGFFETQKASTSGLAISNNTIKNFHGGIYLTNSKYAKVSGNTFENVSFANIYNMGNSNQFTNNIFSFPGNLVVGDAIDVINSSELVISDNTIASGSGYGIYIMGGQNLTIENNKISDGMSYAISIETPSIAAINKAKYLNQFLSNQRIKWASNNNIVVNNNYFAQNRYGISGGKIDHLTVTNNIFIQRFADSGSRQYWTNNNILLPFVASLTWTDNQYKEAFTQEVPGDNTNTTQFVTFPQTGGVVLP